MLSSSMTMRTLRGGGGTTRAVGTATVCFSRTVVVRVSYFRNCADATLRARPSTVTVNSSGRRSPTGCPLLFTTVTSISTTSTPDRNVGGC